MSLKTADEESLKIKIGQKFGEWKIIMKLDEGGFGKVFQVENVNDPSKVGALKAEPSEVEGGAAIKLEIAILKTLQRRGIRSHVPELYRSKKRKRFDYMIVTLLGDNLRSLQASRTSKKITPETWSRLAIQCLYGIKQLHDVGFIHRDIKPANFVMGYRADAERARVVHILDFGMAREFAKLVDGKWLVRKARAQCDFRGTYRFCSPNVHLGREQGRVDDIWSLMYMLIEMNSTLPWQKERDKRMMAALKQNVPDSLLLINFPQEMHIIIPELRKLHYYNRPNYSMIHECCLNLMKRLKVSWNDPYDWENKNEVEELIKLRKEKPDYEDAQKYFDSDPLQIDKPPLKSEKTVRSSIKISSSRKE